MPKAKVSIVKVEKGNVVAAVKEAIELLGGIESFVKGAKKVLLKPNLLMAPKKKEAREKIRTDPRILETLSNMLLESNRTVLIGDNSGMGVIGGTRTALKFSGFLPLAEKDGIEVRSLEKNGPIIAEINGKKLKRANIAKDVIEAEAIINVPKMKTHSSTIYTGAIKNLLGTVCGADKTRIHAFAPTIKSFSQSLVDIYAFEKPKIVLNVMDAIIAMEGMGPGTSGKAVQMDLILASNDAVALDAVAFTIMGHDPKKVPTTRLAAEQGLGVMALEKIEILGEKIEEHKRKFKLPGTAILFHLPFSRGAKLVTKVPVYKVRCKGCKACETACPKSVITIIRTKDGKPKPKIDYSGCISCFTCLEVCPEACYGERMKYRKTLAAIFASFAIIFGGTITLLALLL